MNKVLLIPGFFPFFYKADVISFQTTVLLFLFAIYLAVVEIITNGD